MTVIFCTLQKDINIQKLKDSYEWMVIPSKLVLIRRNCFIYVFKYYFEFQIIWTLKLAHVLGILRRFYSQYKMFYN